VFILLLFSTLKIEFMVMMWILERFGQVLNGFDSTLVKPLQFGEAGLCGGSYYRSAAVLDAFSDESLG
jgi:hypothetical protein